MKKDDKIYLNHILLSIKKVEKYTSMMDLQTFIDDEVIQDAVVRQFEIIGEASNHVSDVTTKRIPDFPWKDIVSMRNILIHDYFEVDLKDVWNTVKNDLPVLKHSIEKFLDDDR